MKYPVLNKEGKEVEQMTLPKEIFGVALNEDLLWQVVNVQMSKRRKKIAHTKDRSEVSGGGKKPWAQKGLGRARHGSIRSPIWRKGGVVFGPRKDKIFERKIPAKMRKKALFMALSSKVSQSQLVLLDELKIEKPKTKLVSEIMANLPLKGKSALVVLPGMDKNLILAFRNISGIRTLQAGDLNSLDLLSFQYLVMPRESVKKIKETFLK